MNDCRDVAAVLTDDSGVKQAWREGNRGVADFMLQKITGMARRLLLACLSLMLQPEHDQRLRLLPPRDVSFAFVLVPNEDAYNVPQRVSLATKLLEIGKSILKSVGDAPPNPDGAPQLNAVKWMQKAFTVIDLSDDTTAPGIRDLKVLSHPSSRIDRCLTNILIALYSKGSR